MKKLLSITAFIVLACCASSSCQGGGAITVPDVDKAKTEAVNSIRNEFSNQLAATRDSMNFYRSLIDSYVNDEVKGRLSEGLDTAFKRNIEDLSAISRNIEKEYFNLTKSVKENTDTVHWHSGLINVHVGLIVASYVLTLLLFLYLYFKRPSEKRVNGIIEDSLQQSNYKEGFDAYGRVSEIIENKLNGAGKPSQNAEQMFNSQMTAWLNNKHNHAAILRVLGSSQPNPASNVENNVPNTTPTYQTSNSGYVQNQPQPVVEFALYARESLSNASKSYVSGKSIYKLVLASENSTVASVELCAEESGRIIEISDYLEDCCTFEKFSSRPSTVMVANPGKAELRNGQWTLIDKVKVELR